MSMQCGRNSSPRRRTLPCELRQADRQLTQRGAAGKVSIAGLPSRRQVTTTVPTIAATTPIAHAATLELIDTPPPAPEPAAEGLLGFR